MNKYLEKVAANWAKIGDKLATGKIPKNSKVFKQPSLKDKLFKGKKEQLGERTSELTKAIHAKGDTHSAKYHAEREKAYLANKAGNNSAMLEHGRNTGKAWDKMSKSRESGARALLNLKSTRAQRLSGENAKYNSPIETTAREMGRESGEPVDRFLKRMKEKHG